MIRQQATLPNADEAARQHVLDEAPEKLHRGERHRAPLVIVSVVPPPEGHARAVEGDQPVVADRDPVGIAPELPSTAVAPPKAGFAYTTQSVWKSPSTNACH